MVLIQLVLGASVVFGPLLLATAINTAMYYRRAKPA